MVIKIVTDGDAANTKIWFNDEPIEAWEFSFSVRGGGKCKIQMQARGPDGKPTPMSFFANDFSKYDEKGKLQTSPTIGNCVQK